MAFVLCSWRTRRGLKDLSAILSLMRADTRAEKSQSKSQGVERNSIGALEELLHFGLGSGH